MDSIDDLIEKLSDEQLKLSKRKRINIEETDPIPKPQPVESQDDLMAIKLRDVIDPTRFYKRNSIKSDPKNFQVGTVIEHPIDFYSARVPKKQRNTTLLDDLLSGYKSTVKKRFYNNMVKAKAKALADRRKKLQGKKKLKATTSSKTKKH